MPHVSYTARPLSLALLAPALWLGWQLTSSAAGSGLPPAGAGTAPAQIRAQPDSLVYGHAANVYLQVLCAGRLDDDLAADLVIGELPTGLHGDERTESALLLGRATWPTRAGTDTLGRRTVLEPVANVRDRFGFLASGDLDGDGRDDLVTVSVRQPGEVAQYVRLGLHWSPPAWSARPDFTRADVVLEIPSKVVPDAAAVGDVDGDGMADLVLAGAEGTQVVRGRRPWPVTLSLGPADVDIAPASSAVVVADVTGDGRADIWLAASEPVMDGALLLGRESWPAAMDAAAEGDFVLGTGSHQLAGWIVPDVSGDGLADVLRVDHGAQALEVYDGGPDVVARLAARTPDWSVTGISDTFSVAALDLTGDGLAELLVDRHAVIAGRADRSGTLDIAGGGYDAEWPNLGDGPLWSLDVDGQRGDDVLVGDSSAAVAGRRGAGSISIYLSPLFVPPTAAPTATPTATPSSTPSSTPTAAAPAPTDTGTPQPVGSRRLWLPAARRHA